VGGLTYHANIGSGNMKIASLEVVIVKILLLGSRKIKIPILMLLWMQTSIIVLWGVNLN